MCRPVPCALAANPPDAQLLVSSVLSPCLIITGLPLTLSSQWWTRFQRWFNLFPCPCCLRPRREPRLYCIIFFISMVSLVMFWTGPTVCVTVLAGFLLSPLFSEHMDISPLSSRSWRRKSVSPLCWLLQHLGSSTMHSSPHL